MHVAITGQPFIFSAHASYLNSNWAIHLYESVDETIGYAKVVYCGGGYDIYEFASPKFIHITGPNGYELEGTNRGEVQRKFNLHHNPFNTL